MISEKLAKLARKYIAFQKNFSYDFYKNGEFDLLRKLSPLGFETIFDVGSNVGDWSETASQLFPKATLHTFELSGTTFENLKSRLRAQKFVHNNVGLSDVCGPLLYKDYGANSGVNTLLLDATYHDKSVQHQEVLAHATTGDVYCADRGISKIDYLKIDVEGAEHLVLKGFSSMLGTQNVRAVQFEYGYTHGDAKFLMRDFYKLFDSFGYQVARINRGPIVFRAWEYKDNDFDSGPNYLAIRRADHEIQAALKR